MQETALEKRVEMNKSWADFLRCGAWPHQKKRGCFPSARISTRATQAAQPARTTELQVRVSGGRIVERTPGTRVLGFLSSPSAATGFVVPAPVSRTQSRR